MKNIWKRLFITIWSLSRYKRRSKKSKIFNDKLSKKAIHEKLQKLNLIIIRTDFDATSLYPNATYDENSAYPRKESGFSFQPDMIDEYVKSFNYQIFNQNGDEAAISKIE